MAPNGPICQSCGKPLDKPEDFGTNADGSESAEYCNRCYQKGSFTYPDITMEQMVDIAAGLMMSLALIGENEAKNKAKTLVPKLKRWKK